MDNGQQTGYACAASLRRIGPIMSRIPRDKMAASREYTLRIYDLWEFGQ